MSKEFVLAVHTETHVLQRVPEHYLDTLPYFKRATKAQIEEAQTAKPKPQAKPKPAEKEGSK